MDNATGFMKKTYKVEFFYTIENIRVGEVEIEASSEEEAEQLAKEMDDDGELSEFAGREECESCNLNIVKVEKI